METPGNLRPEAFAGAAEAYLRYRPPYPRALLDDLVGRAAGRGLLVDLACGPGRVALDLAAAFERVIAIDLEPEMVAVGQREAARRGIANIDWRIGRAEDLDLATACVDLVTVGEAFHRLDQGVLCAKAMDWLKPAGLLATLGTRGLLDGPEPWQRTAGEVARAWMARAFPGGWGEGRAGAETGPGAAERVLAGAGFETVTSRDFTEALAWSFDGIIGYFRSTSVCSERALGADFPQFEAALRTALGVDDPAAVAFRETLRAGYTLGRRPR